MRREFFWRLLFTAAIAAVLLAILLAGTVTPPIWVLICYPAVGALLAHIVSRTAPNRHQIAWLETASIAAACVLIIAMAVNALAEVLFLDDLRAEGGGAGQTAEIAFFCLLTVASLASWWGLERWVRRIRESRASDPEKIPAQ